MTETSRWQHLRRLWRLVRKEVSTILRDRRTIITLVLMPLLLYPLLSTAFRQFMLAGGHGVSKRPDLILSAAPEHEGPIKSHLSRGEDMLRILPVLRGVVVPKTPPAVLRYLPASDPVEEVRQGRADLALRLARPTDDQRINRGVEQALDCEVYYLEGSVRGREAFERVQVLFECAHEQLLFERRRPAASPAASRTPVVLRLIPGALTNPNLESGISLAALIPLVLILMTITGAVYPAIDLTAGERERGTLEILIAAPIPRLDLLFAKYVSVVTVAVLTAVVNLVAMTLTMQLSGLGEALFAGHGLTLLAVVQVFFLLLLFAAFFSAVLLAVTSFARSFKEAQAYLIPLMLVSLTPGVASLLPGLKLDSGMAIVPLLNIVLLARDVLLGEAAAGTGAIVVVTTLLYALGGVAVAARIFGAEAVLNNEQAGWSDLFRRPAQPVSVPTLGGAMMCLALLFPATFVTSGLLAKRSGSTAEEMAWRSLANVLLFGGLPMLFLWVGRVRLLSGYRLERLGLLFWVAALLLGVGLWPFAGVVRHALQELGLGLDPERLAGATEQLQSWRAVSPLLLLAGSAVLPAVLEELFFRGFLFGALLRVSGPRAAIIGSALFFGAFHLVDQGLIVAERGLASTLLGLVLAWLCWRSGSVVPGMILHAVHNSCLILMAYYQAELTAAGWLNASQERVPLTWLAAGFGICVSMAIWVELVCRKQVDTSESIG